MSSSEEVSDVEQGRVNSGDCTQGAVKDCEVQKSHSADASFKTSEGVETMLYDEAPPTCCSRFCGEWRLKFFELSETDEAMIDVHRSFAAPPLWRTFFIKAAITGWAISILVFDLLDDIWNPITYYFIYLSHWSLAIAILYLLVSLTNTVIGVPEQRPYEDTPGFMIKFAWGLYPTAAVSQMTTTILFWVLLFDPPVTYKMVMKHGVIMLLVLLEGRFVNLIPVRQKHLLFPMLFATLFVIWTIIHDVLGLGNPYVADSDAIYEALNWNEQVTESLITSVVLVFAVTPLLFLNVWILSIWAFPFHFDGLNRHHYYLEEKEKPSSWWESMFGWAYKDKKAKGASES